MKRSLKIIILTVLLLAVTAALAVAASAVEVVDSGQCGDNLTWTLYDDGLLEISGTGEMWNYDDWSNKSPWHEYQSQLNTLKLNEDLTTIGAFAFSGFSGFTGSLAIPDSVTEIGQFAFSGCSGFTGSLTVPDSVTTIGNTAFSDCSGFTGSLTIPDSVMEIGNSAFAGCTGFTGSLTIPDSVTTIGAYAFYGCTGFTGNLKISEGVTTIGSNAFYGCGFTGSLIIPDSVKTIESYAFYGCGFTGRLKIGNSVTYIGIGAFQNCLYFSGGIKIPASVSVLGEGAFAFFSYASSNPLTSVYFYGDAPIIDGKGTPGFYDLFYGIWEYSSYHLSTIDCLTVYYLEGTSGWENFSEIYRCLLFGKGTSPDKDVGIIVVPGITGSELYGYDENGNQQAWWSLNPATVNGITQYLWCDGKGESLYRVYAPGESDSPYGTLNTYQSLVEGLKAAFEPDYDVTFFGYDWRLTNTEAADALHKYIEDRGYDKVILVAHSMGGIVSSLYIDRYDSNGAKVDKLITLGTPFLGSPQACKALINGDFLHLAGISVSRFLPDPDNMLLYGLAQNLPAVYELLPNQRYFENNNYYIESIGLLGKGSLDYQNSKSLLENVYQKNQYLLTQSEDLYSELYDTYDKLKNGDINSYFIVGRNTKTISCLYVPSKTLELLTNILNAFIPLSNPWDLDEYGIRDLDINMNGDGTVPLISSTMNGGLNNDGAKKRVYYQDGIDHTGLATNSSCIDLVIDLIRGEEPQQQKESLRDQSEGLFTGYKIYAACPVNLTVNDADGAWLGTVGTDVFDTAEGHEYDFYLCGQNNEIKIAFVDNPADIVIEGYDEGSMDLTISRYENGEIVEDVIYTEVPVTAQTVFTTSTDMRDGAHLEVTENGEPSDDIYPDDVGLAVTASGECGDDLTWTLYENGLLEISGTGEMYDYDNSKNKAPWREYSSELKSLKLNAGITKIGNHAFDNCSELSGSLTIPASVTEIGESAFFSCSGFVGDLIIPNSVLKIGKCAFSICSGMTGKLMLSEKLSCIEVSTFSKCGFTGSLTIADSVTIIGDNAFDECSGFTGNLTIPASVTEIGYHAFSDCRGFTGSLKIGDSVAEIGGFAFFRCNGFTGNLTIGNSVTEIGQNAFAGCTGFTGSLTIPKGVKTIDTCSFEACRGFSGSLMIPDGVTMIGDSAFSYCSGFTGTLTIPDSVTTIGRSAFSGCSGFTGILIIPTGVTTIGSGAFSDCSSFTGVLTLPDGLTMIGNGAFYNCAGIESAEFEGSAPEMGSYVFDGCADGFTVFCLAENAESFTSGDNYDAAAGTWYGYPLTVLNRAVYQNTEGDGATYTGGSGSVLTFFFKRSVNDGETFGHFAGVKVDGTDLPEDKYSARSGSLVIELLPEYLDTLEAGEHTLTVLFDDGDDVSVSFRISEKQDEPSNPDEPEQPDEPEKPDEPDKPDDPESPDEPGKPDQPALSPFYYQMLLWRLRQRNNKETSTDPALPALTETPAEKPLPFTDLTPGTETYRDAEILYNLGIMLGMSDTVFGADQPLTRGMIVTVLYRLEGEPKVMGTQFFKDVAPDAWYAEAVGWAAERGIVFGYGNGVFGPQDDITREQLAAILYRYAQFKGYDVSVGEDTNILSWDDAFTISDWANSAMRWACGCGIYGDDDPILRPVEPATRGEIAGAIRVFLENVAK